MDKIQIYYTVVIAFSFLANLINVAKTMKKDSGFEATLTLFFMTALGLPTAGRIYGWW